MRLWRLPDWARIQKVLFPISKKRVQFSVDRSLNASKLTGKRFWGGKVRPFRQRTFTSDL
jgi:hypothetical protein